MLTLTIVCPSMGNEEQAIKSWKRTAHWSPMTIHTYDETTGEHAGFLNKLQRGYEEEHTDLLAYFHSDLFIHEEGWDERIREEFQEERVAVVGFVGAKRLGRDDLYRTPYDFRQLARAGVLSNLADAEIHGSRETGSQSVAVLDSCAVVVRRSFLERVGGWPVARYPNSSHCTDLWICAMAHRAGMAVHVVGVKCSHLSGGKGTKGTEWLDARGGDASMHQRAHELIYEDFRDVLPIVIRSEQ